MLKYRIFIPRFIVYRHYATSLLFVPGAKKSQQVSIVSPHLDFDDRFHNISELERNVKARRLSINVKKCHEMWQILCHVNNSKSTIEKKRAEIPAKIKELQECGKVQEAEKYIHQAKLLREELKSLSKTIWELEEISIPKALNLPNDLHPDTPLESEICLYKNDEPLTKCSESHVEIAEKFDLIDWRNNNCFFFLNNAALYETLVLSVVSELLKRDKYIEVSNSDFVRSIVLEGCGMSFDNPSISFLLQDDGEKNLNRLHLVGSASLPSFCCLHSKHYVSENVLPLRYVTVGRQYKPTEETEVNGLFSTWQETVVGVFVATPSISTMMDEFNCLVKLITKFYQQFKYPLKIVYVPAHKLQIHENLRVSIQMYSPNSQAFIEVGNISISGSFLSKRLLMCYQKSDNENKFLNIVSGTLLSAPKFIGCAMENDYCRNEELLVLERINNGISVAT
ncbi:hypothetical protein R5R35_008806 [Gryllus longicercus]|uniref:Aminoacyl-tRNA synthetase class II (G/ P/ S/T) domain-containing protein n=1 Tax=Gryllus longicercus TaxID=2509291 RepID=A0AAN9Z9N3_9ORTH